MEGRGIDSRLSQVSAIEHCYMWPPCLVRGITRIGQGVVADWQDNMIDLLYHVITASEKRSPIKQASFGMSHCYRSVHVLIYSYGCFQVVKPQLVTAQYKSESS